MKLVAATLAAVAFGWALVTSADARHQAKPVQYETIVIETTESSQWEDALAVETPIADALVDFDEVQRQTDCLWDFMQDAGVEITLEIVMAAGVWTDALGGACLVIGEDSE